MNPVEDIPPFYLDFTVSALVDGVGTLDDETVQQARQSIIDQLREDLKKHLDGLFFTWGIAFEVIDFSTQEVQP